MNNKKGIVLLSLGSLVCLTVGFVLGQVVQAVTAMPGSADDPLVSQSYVEKIVGERTAAIQTQLEELEAQIKGSQNGSSTSNNNNNNNNSTTNNNTSNTNNSTSNNNNNSTATTGKTVEITVDSLNVRSGAGTTYSKIGSVKKGDKLTYMETKSTSDGNWYKVKLSDGTIGWISAKYGKLS